MATSPGVSDLFFRPSRPSRQSDNEARALRHSKCPEANYSVGSIIIIEEQVPLRTAPLVPQWRFGWLKCPLDEPPFARRPRKPRDLVRIGRAGHGEVREIGVRKPRRLGTPHAHHRIHGRSRVFVAHPRDHVSRAEVCSPDVPTFFVTDRAPVIPGRPRPVPRGMPLPGAVFH